MIVNSRSPNSPTEAAIRQTLQNQSTPIMLDEMDENPYRPKILQLLRTTSQGGQVLRGGADHTTRSFHVHHIAWLAGIDGGDNATF